MSIWFTHMVFIASITFFFFTAVDYLSGPLRKHHFTCDWQVLINQSIFDPFCLFLFFKLHCLAVTLIMIDSSNTMQLSVDKFLTFKVCMFLKNTISTPPKLYWVLQNHQVGLSSSKYVIKYRWSTSLYLKNLASKESLPKIQHLEYPPKF